ncbi:glycosyltransferase, partial [bacterium]|nr:glycosyltransferase [bacterium]
PALGEADIGVIDYAYRVEPTLNQKYCAPTKLFEFMACGLALLGSANDSLYSIIVEHEIGACATDDSIEALAAALNKLLRYTANDLQSVKARARRVFAEKFSYEKCCSEPLRELVTFLKIEEGDTEGKGAAAVLRD